MAASVIWEPLEALAKTLTPNGKLRPLLDIHEGVIKKITVVLAGTEEHPLAVRSWTLEDAQKAKARVLD